MFVEATVSAAPRSQHRSSRAYRTKKLSIFSGIDRTPLPPESLELIQQIASSYGGAQSGVQAAARANAVEIGAALAGEIIVGAIIRVLLIAYWRKRAD